MTIPPLCIIQARYNSTRLPGKMLLTLSGETLIARAWLVACEAFGAEHCVVAIPANADNNPLVDELERIGARAFQYTGEENDVLGRFHACAHLYRWHPDSVIIRFTPDDHRKDVNSLRRVASGERLPVEQGGEAFTLAMLDAAVARHLPPGSAATLLSRIRRRLARPVPDTALPVSFVREHITHALFPTSPPSAPPGCWTIDTPADHEAAQRYIGQVAADYEAIVLDNWRECVAVPE